MDINPRLIVLRVPPAGLTGDWSSYTGFGAQFDGLSGMVSICGHHDEDPVNTPATTYMDLATGPAGAFAVMAALNYRTATGRGQIIELAQIENILGQLGDVLIETQLGHAVARLGNRDPALAPQGVYRCAQGRWLALSVLDDEAWVQLTRVLARPELAADEELASVGGRYRQHDRLDEIIGQWTAEQDVLAAFHTLQSAGVAAAPLFDDELLYADENVAAREWIRPLSSQDVGTHLHLGHAFRGLPQRWDRGSPSLGEDNEYVYRQVIGVGEEEYRHLQATQIAIEDYLDRDGRPV
jgi:crotonobetainyl-CoA:carnitine CoA-transferase CaiB-like acyl-CoA transferase